MRLVFLDEVRPGAVLARPVYNERGAVLLAAGVELTDALISRLKARGIGRVYVRDPRTADVEVKGHLRDETVQYALGELRRIAELLLDDCQGFHHALRAGKIAKRVADVVDTLLTEVRQSSRAVFLLSDLYAYDTPLFLHSLHVAVYTLVLATALGFPERDVREIALGALLHDIGKLLIPRQILDKPGRLTDEEFAVVKQHAALGFELLRKGEGISLPVAHCAFQHHERLDGSGYPRGLKEEEIHRYAKVLMVADVFEALTAHRVYRRAMLPHEALELMEREAGTKLPASVVRCLRDHIVLYPIGVTVRLNTGEEGVVVDTNTRSPDRPVVRVLRDPSGRDLPEAEVYELDLSKHPDRYIVVCQAWSR